MGRVVYIRNGSDNRATFVLEADESPLDMSGVTRVRVEIDDAAGTMLDSDTTALEMAWGTLVDGEYPVTFNGSAAGLSAGVYRDCRVRIFDGNSTDGLVWPEPLTLIVED